MKNILRLGIGGLFCIVSSHAIAFHFETTIANKTNQALTIHCEDHACAYCDADMMIEAGQTIAYWTGYNNGGGNPFNHCFYDSTVALLHFKDANGKELYEAELHGSQSNYLSDPMWSYTTTYMRDIYQSRFKFRNKLAAHHQLKSQFLSHKLFDCKRNYHKHF